MKSYLVDLDVTMSVRLHIEANSQEEAENMAKKKIKTEPHYHLRNSFFVDVVVIDALKENETNL
jgi:hypothetical protein